MQEVCLFWPKIFIGDCDMKWLVVLGFLCAMSSHFFAMEGKRADFEGVLKKMQEFNPEDDLTSKDRLAKVAKTLRDQVVARLEAFLSEPLSPQMRAKVDTVVQSLKPNKHRSDPVLDKFSLWVGELNALKALMDQEDTARMWAPPGCVDSHDDSLILAAAQHRHSPDHSHDGYAGDSDSEQSTVGGDSNRGLPIRNRGDIFEPSPYFLAQGPYGQGFGRRRRAQSMHGVDSPGIAPLVLTAGTDVDTYDDSSFIRELQSVLELICTVEQEARVYSVDEMAFLEEWKQKALKQITGLKDGREEAFERLVRDLFFDGSVSFEDLEQCKQIATLFELPFELEALVHYVPQPALGETKPDARDGDGVVRLQKPPARVYRKSNVRQICTRSVVLVVFIIWLKLMLDAGRRLAVKDEL